MPSVKYNDTRTSCGVHVDVCGKRDPGRGSMAGVFRPVVVDGGVAGRCLATGFQGDGCLRLRHFLGPEYPVPDDVREALAVDVLKQESQRLVSNVGVGEIISAGGATARKFRSAQLS